MRETAVNIVYNFVGPTTKNDPEGFGERSAKKEVHPQEIGEGKSAPGTGGA